MGKIVTVLGDIPISMIDNELASMLGGKLESVADEKPILGIGDDLVSKDKLISVLIDEIASVLVDELA